ncbi:hypothetical protein BDZ85DRAFT_305161 [Elsinoe ampelina]|uniref:Phosphatidate phosphatase APP1 catalytic domain-containing protein n=1 Tax=Elsinoe ampelina TaxID=302913 RepID=A0A6A6G0M7_9PEZI|nr:hypothetical protein BDZ85DRAFT_305161 [Elsinoe ampelina]
MSSPCLPPFDRHLSSTASLLPQSSPTFKSLYHDQALADLRIMTEYSIQRARPLKFDQDVQVRETRQEDNVTDGRPARSQLSFLVGQLPALIRHIPSYTRRKGVKHVNPKKHYVWVFDNIAFRASSTDKEEMAANTPLEDSMNSDNPFFKMMNREKDPWQVEYVAAFFKRKGGKELAKSVGRLCRELDVEQGSLSEDRVRCRVQHFVDHVLPGHAIHTSIGHGIRHLHGPSSSSGLSLTFSTLPTTGRDPQHVVVNSFPGAKSARCFLAGTTTFAEPTGWGVISDIDDTIKVTLTASSLGVLTTTFLEEARPVAGMPQLYSSLQTLLCSPTFFYVSASPYNLYPFLRNFREEYFPMGPIMLRESTWQSFGGLISSLMEDVQTYKLDRITKIHSWFPHRRFILIGDSTHKDPETYADVIRKYGDWVVAVFIRRVTGVSDVGNPHQEEKNSDERFEKAFEGIDTWKWFVFDEPEEVQVIVSQMVDEGTSVS